MCIIIIDFIEYKQIISKACGTRTFLSYHASEVTASSRVIEAALSTTRNTGRFRRFGASRCWVMMMMVMVLFMTMMVFFMANMMLVFMFTTVGAFSRDKYDHQQNDEIFDGYHYIFTMG